MDYARQVVYYSRMNTLPTVRPSTHGLAQVIRFQSDIRALVKVTSPVLVAACEQAGIPGQAADTCAGMLATVVDDLIKIGQLRRTDFERSKRLERIIWIASNGPSAWALKLAIAASPINGFAAVRHWDAVCDKSERGRLAAILGMQTDAAAKYSRRLYLRNKRDGAA